MMFQNIGGTDLEWKFKIDDNSRYEVIDNPENPTNNALIDFNKSIIEKKNFSFKPKKGKLAPNEKQKIQITYHPFQNEEVINSFNERSTEDLHTLKAFIQIQNGKTIKLTFKGKTLSSFQGKLVLKSQLITLPTLPINMTMPVIIPVGLLNIGSNNLKYQINRKKFYQENKINPRENIISFENFDATLHPSEKKYLKILFKPVEYKTYEFNATLKVYDFFKEIQSIELKLIGKGSQDLKQINKNIFFKMDDDIEAEKQILSSHENIAYLSEEQLDFRNIEYGTTHKRILFLYNNSKCDNCSFEFLNFNIIKNDKFRITPDKGIIAPKGRVLITFCLEQRGKPTFWEGEINCKIYWSTNVNNISHDNVLKLNTTNEDKTKNQDEMLFIRVKKSPNIVKFQKLALKDFYNDKVNSNMNLEEAQDQELLNFILDNTFENLFKFQNLKKIAENFDEEKINYFLQMDDQDMFTFNKINNFFDVSLLKDDHTNNQIVEEQHKQVQDNFSSMIDDNFINPSILRYSVMKPSTPRHILKTSIEYNEIIDEIFNEEQNVSEEPSFKKNFETKLEIFSEIFNDLIIDNLTDIIKEKVIISNQASKNLIIKKLCQKNLNYLQRV